ncbi:hypothetical protein [Streptomyces roseolilacinus]|uniref:CopC domain-containing protein n=1 Tax=Streptomyces roseolilacinus TaxID=66904 RepID=A0A918B1H7_9ACTN|nr:hypothetical protein [Streptomyces roseolilacinus]GGP99936.1 hypothetical protein GCM10010249_17680 [Streptomyces roseolilacinus]
MTRPVRSLRAAAAAALAGPALWLAAPGGAHAHGGGLEVDVTGQSFGHLAATVTWAGDGDPVDERVAATVNAVSADGRTALGPWRLVRAAGTATGYTTAEALPPGRWEVTVEVGHPGLGRARERVTVPPGTPASRPPSAPGPSAGPATAPGPAPGTRPGPGTAPGTASGSAVAPASGTAAGSGTASGSGTAGPGGGSATGLAAAVAAAVAAACGARFVLVRRRAGAAPGGTPTR